MVWMLFVFLLLGVSFGESRSCKCLYGDSCFPNQAAWAGFNNSIGGRLLTPRPAGYACHDPHYDEKACNETINKWTDSLWRSQQPGTLELPQFETYGNKSCFHGTSRDSSCDQGSVPVYAVNVSGAADVQATINFARERNLKLVIKNTGHDYLGRSTARGALSLWMHNLKDIQFLHYQSCFNSPAYAVKIGAGVQFTDLNAAATKNSVVIVGATSASVGVAGGWWQGAGHGNLSPHFGLGADNVLEIELVTASGEHVIANACTNPDLFWAMRGGGGGTFGVVLSVTMATHPAPANVLSASVRISSTNTTSFESLLSLFAGLQPRLTDMGWSGTFSLSTNSLSLNYMALSRDPSFINASLVSLFNFVHANPGLNLTSVRNTTYETYEDWYTQKLCLVYGYNMDNGRCVDRIGTNRAHGTRLIPRYTLEFNARQMGELLIKLANTTNKNVLGMSIAGGAVSRPQHNAVNPAWRNAIWHLIISDDWEDTASLDEIQSRARDVRSATKMMEDLTPGSGAYFNEADYNQPDWQSTFFGINYPALKEIKDLRDPTGLFLCWHCVGSEEWDNDLRCPLV